MCSRKQDDNLSEQSSSDHGGLRAAVAQCWANPAFLQEITDILADADAAITAKGLTCRGCGKCCDFRKAGHRLYVSTGELAMIARNMPTDFSAAAEMRCPWQINSSCTARADRSLGCRLYFCCQDAAEWYGQLYEKLHQRIACAHSRWGIAYLYTELTAGLTCLACED